MKARRRALDVCRNETHSPVLHTYRPVKEKCADWQCRVRLHASMSHRGRGANSVGLATLAHVGRGGGEKPSVRTTSPGDDQ